MGRMVVLLLLLSIYLWGKEVATVKRLNGAVDVKRDHKVLALKVGKRLKTGDIIMTKKGSAIGITFDDGSRISLGEKAIFVIKAFTVDSKKQQYNVDLDLQKGKAVFSSGKIGELSPESVKFHIPEGIIGIRGTAFAVEVQE